MKPSRKSANVNIMNRRADILLRIVPVPLAGGGPTLHAIQIDEMMADLQARYRIPVRRIGIRGSMPSFIEEEITGKFYSLDRAIEPASTIHDTYKNARSAVESEIDYLYDQGIRHFAAVCCGYTSYGSYALQCAVEKKNKTNPQNPITGNVIIQDSSFPDTDKLSTDLDEDGYPITRFHGPAYQSSGSLRFVFTANGAVPFDIKLSKRMPQGCSSIVTTVPFSQRYIEMWKAAGSLSVPEARKGDLSEVIGGFEHVRENGWLVSLLASGGIWEAANVGKWMRETEFETVKVGTCNIVKGLVFIAKRTGRPIFLVIHAAGAEFILRQQLADVASIEKFEPDKANVYLLRYENLPQSRYMDLITGSNIVINRAVQANSFVETILALRPQLVITMPADGYMEAELMAEHLSKGRVPYDTTPDTIGNELLELLTRPEYSAENVNANLSVFNAMNINPSSSFMKVIAYVAGLPT